MQSSESGEPRRRIRVALSESEERFRLLVEGVKDYAIFMLDPEGHITTWNPGAQRIKGYEAEEILGEHFSIFYTDEDIERGHPEEELRIAAAEGQLRGGRPKGAQGRLHLLGQRPDHGAQGRGGGPARLREGDAGT